MMHIVQVRSSEEAKNNNFWESCHKFHLEIQILIKPGEGRSGKWTQ
jgi:hypothetical protein